MQLVMLATWTMTPAEALQTDMSRLDRVWTALDGLDLLLIAKGLADGHTLYVAELAVMDGGRLDLDDRTLAGHLEGTGMGFTVDRDGIQWGKADTLADVQTDYRAFGHAWAW